MSVFNLNFKSVVTWNTGSGNWTTTSQWDSNTPPVDGDTVEFSGAGGTSTNDFASGNLSAISGITFTSNATGAYTVNGNTLQIGEDGIVNASNQTQTIAINLTLGANQTFAANTANLVVSGNISGGYALTKEGNQTLTLAGANTYTGITTLSAGTLALGNADALSGSTLDHSSNATLIFNLPGANTYNIGGLAGDSSISIGNNTLSIGANNESTAFAGAVSGTGSLIKVGTGTLTLSGSNTYTGETSINAGTVAIASGGSLSGTSKIFVGNSTSDNALEILGSVGTGNLTLSHQVGSNNNTVTVGNGTSPASLTVSNLLNVGFGGTGNTLNILGNGTVTAGATEIGGYGANNTLNLTGGKLNSTGYLVVGYYADGNALNITSGGNATVGSVTIGLDAGSSNNTILVSGSGSALHTPGLIYLGQNGTNNSLLVQNGGKVVSGNPDAVIGFNAGSNGNALSINGTGSQFTNNGTLYIGRNGSENSLTVQNGASLVTSNSRIGHEAVSSNNTATVSGAGTTWANTGTLRVGNLGSNNTLAVTSGANVTISGNTFIGHGAGSENNLVSVEGAGSVLNLANATIGLSGSNNRLLVADSGTINAIGIQLSGTNATLQIGNGAAGGTITTSLGIGTGTGTGHQVIFNHTDSNLVFSPILTGNLSVSQIGTGTTTLTASNTYTGTTTIDAGILATSGNDRIATGNSVIVNAPGTFTLGGNQTLASVSGNGTIQLGDYILSTGDSNSTYSGTLAGNGGLTKSGNGTFTLTGNGTFTGDTNITGGTLVLASNSTLSKDAVVIMAAGTTLTVNQRTFIGALEQGGGTVNGNGTLVLTLTITDNGSLDSVLANGPDYAAGILKRTSGTTTIGAANTFTGVVKIQDGILQLTGNGSFDSGSSLVLNPGGTMDLNNKSQTFSAVSGAGGTISTGSGSLTVNQSTDTTYNGIVTGSGSLNKQGGGTLTLGGNNTYSGGTTISAGTLAVSSGGSISHSAANMVIGASSGDNGTLAINGGNITNALGTIGRDAGSTGVVNVSSGNWTNTNLRIGSLGNGTLNLTGGTVANSGNYTNIGWGNSSTGVANVSSGNWTNGDELRIGLNGNGTLNITGGNVTNQAGFLAYELGSTGVVNVSGGNWTNTDRLRLGRYGNGTLNLTGGNVTIGSGGTGNLTVAVSSNSTGTLNIGTGTTAGNLQAARVTGGNGTAIVNFNHSGNHTFAPILEGNLAVNKLGNGTTTLAANNTYSGNTTVKNGAIEVAAGGSINSAANVFIGSVNGDNGTLNINGGSVSNAVGYLGNDAGSVGTATVSAGSWTNNGYLVIGNSGTGSLTISGGNVSNTVGNVASSSGSNGTVSVSGGTWTNSGDLTIGYGGTGSLTINGTGTVTNAIGSIGHVAGGVGTVNISGGTWANSSYLFIGAANGSRGSLTINSGNVTNADGYVGNGASSNGTASVSGGTWTNSGDLTIGRDGTGSLAISGGNVTNTIGNIGLNAGSNGMVNVSGGNWTNSGQLYVGKGGTGNLTISGGTVSNQWTEVAALAGSSGSATVSAGIWNSGNLYVGVAGNGTLNISGGVVNSAGATLGLYSGSGEGSANISGGTWTNTGDLNVGMYGNGSLTISGGNVTNTDAWLGKDADSNGTGNGTVSVSGGTWANSNNLTIGEGGSGSLTINGTGRVIVGGTLSRGSNGTISLESGGTLQIGTGGSTGTLATDLTNDGTLLFDISSESTYALEISGTGTVIKNGAGQLVFTGNNTYTGGTSINQGTLYLRTDIFTPGGESFNIGNMTVASGATLMSERGSLVGNLTLNGGTWVESNGFGGSLAGSVALGATSTFQTDYYQTATANITGTGGLVKTGAGTLILSGNNSYSGTTEINSGKLLANGVQSSSPTTVNSGGTLGGTGTVGNVTINSGGTIAPGTSDIPSILTVGNSVWNGGGIYNWELASSNGTAGMDWDLIRSPGSLTINATSGNKFTISLASYGNGTLTGVKTASWEIGNFTTGITGFSNDYFTFNATGMVGSAGSYSLSLGGGNTTLLLNYASAGMVWNTGSGDWTTDTQWQGSTLPTNGDAIEFSGQGGTSTNNFASGNLSEISGLTFASSANGSYTINGNALAIGLDGIINDSGFEHTIALQLTGGEVLGVNTATNNLTISGAISGNSALTKTGNKTLTLTGSNTYSGGTTVSAGTLAGTTQALKGSIVNNAAVNFNQSFNGTYAGVMSGTGSLTKSGSGVVVLSGNNTYSGGTTINSGVLAASVVSGNNVVSLNPNAFGNGSVNINAGGAMFVPSTIVGGSHLAIGGDLTLNNGTIAFYDIGESPRDQDLRVDVTGNFTNAGNGVVFDFSQVQALNSGNYTLVSYNGTNFATSAISSRAGVGTTLQGSFSFSNNGSSLVYTVVGAQSSGTDIQNKGGPNTPIVANYNVSGPTITIGDNNIVAALTFNSGGTLNIQQDGVLNVSSGTLNVQSGSSVVGGGTLVAPAGLNKDGTGELDFTNNVVVTGTAAVNAGLLSVNGQLQATGGVVVNPNATLGGAGLIVGNVNVKGGNISPGNSPGTLSVAGNLVLTGANATIIEIESPTNYDRIIVSGQATLGGTLNAVAYGGGTITPGARYDFLQAGSIIGEFDSLVAPEGLRVRFLNSGTVGTLLFGPGSYVPMAINQNQRNVAKALDTFIVATDGNRLAVSIALDSLTTEQFPAAFDQIMPGFYESLANMAIEQAFNQTQMLNQRISSVRLGAAGFQAIGGITQPLLHDKNGKSAAEAKDASPIVESATATNWNAWALGTGMFSRTTDLGRLQNYNNDAGGFLVGSDYRWSENFVTGLYAGYDYSYAEYNGGGTTKGNSFNFGTYASYEKDGYYADAVIGGGYTGFQTKRAIEFSTIDRTASADPNSGQFTAGLNLGKDFEVGKFTLGPIVGAQYTYAGIGSFTESGAESLDLSLGQQNANSLRSTLGGRVAYTWNLNKKIALIPEVRMFWQHEFLNNPRNINASLDGGSGPSFGYETTDPYRNSVFAGAGVTAQFGKNLSGSLFYNINFGSQTYQSNMVSAGLNFSF